MFSYSHMCRDSHPAIGHNDSESEMCPLCRAIAEGRELAAELLAAQAALSAANSKVGYLEDRLADQSVELDEARLQYALLKAAENPPANL